MICSKHNLNRLISQYHRLLINKSNHPIDTRSQTFRLKSVERKNEESER
jgi:hypothetical protein